MEVKYFLHRTTTHFILKGELKYAHPTIAPVDIVRKLKSISGNWISQGFPTLKQNKFWGSALWSRGYYIGTISAETIQKYIQNQKLVYCKIKKHPN